MPKARKKTHKVTRREKRTVDSLMGIVAFVGPLSAAPQVINIFIKQETEGVSILTWVLFMVLAVITLAYGVVHKLRPIIISQTLWLCIEALIITGVAMYGSGTKINLSYDVLLILNNIGKTAAFASMGFGVFGLYFSYIGNRKTTSRASR